MDPSTETTFLEILEMKKSVINSKDNTKNGRNRRAEAWSWLQQELVVRTGKSLAIEQLQKKWNNVQQRLKERLKDVKKTGGGPSKELSENDRLVWRVLGEQNPKITKVVGAMENGVYLENLELPPADEQPLKCKLSYPSFSSIIHR